MTQVLAQQSREQARLAVNPAAPESNVATDPGSVIASLPTSIRQQVLADMDDSQVAVLPPDLAAEAQSLRRELEERHRRIMQDRLYSQGLPSMILGDTLLSLVILYCILSGMQFDLERRKSKSIADCTFV